MAPTKGWTGHNEKKLSVIFLFYQKAPNLGISKASAFYLRSFIENMPFTNLDYGVSG
jgi:hypothetical protein